MSQSHRDDISGGIQERYATLGQFLHMNRIENHIHRTDRRVRIGLFDQSFIISDAMCSPHVRDKVLVARIPIACQLRHDLGIHVLDIVQFRHVQRCNDTSLDQARRVAAGMADHVVSAVTCQQFGVNGLRGIIGIIDDLDPIFLFKVGNGVLADILAPIRHFQNAVLREG